MCAILIAGGLFCLYIWATVGLVESSKLFQPPWYLRGGHVQTWAGAYWPLTHSPCAGEALPVSLPDGDQIVLHDEPPVGPQPATRIALLVHGLGGSHGSPYIARLAARLRQAAIRVVRLDQRGCGAAFLLARHTYHSGRSDDVRVAIEFLGRRYPELPLTLVGFSLGANLTLKLLGELGAAPCGRLDSAVAVSPPMNLSICVRSMQRGMGRIYDRYFVRRLTRQIVRRHRLLPQAATLPAGQRPRTLYDIDNCFTAPAGGFADAEAYYADASCGKYVPHIAHTTLVVAAADDPIIPIHLVDQANWPMTVELCRQRHGGHLGFVGSPREATTRFWLDQLIAHWIGQRSSGTATNDG